MKTEQITGPQDTINRFQRKQPPDVSPPCPPKKNKVKFVVWVPGAIQPNPSWEITRDRVLLGKYCFLVCLRCCSGFLSSTASTCFYIKVISNAILTAKIKINSCRHEKVYLIIKWAESKTAQRCLIILCKD